MWYEHGPPGASSQWGLLLGASTQRKEYEWTGHSKETATDWNWPEILGCQPAGCSHYRYCHREEKASLTSVRMHALETLAGWPDPHQPPPTHQQCYWYCCRASEDNKYSQTEMHHLSSGAINVAHGRTLSWRRKPLSLSAVSFETKLVSRETDILVVLPF